jgi:predicted nucleotidyltransferase
LTPKPARPAVVFPAVLRAFLTDANSLLPITEEYGTFAGMDRDFVIAKLREHQPELKAAGIVHLRLHGSLARGAATATSDVDLIAQFDAAKHLSLLDMVGLENRLSDLLGASVDFSPEHTLKEPVAERAAREAVRAF